MNKKELWQKIIHFAITILTAIATTLGNTFLYPKALDKMKINLKSVFSKRMTAAINSIQIEILIALLLDFQSNSWIWKKV